MFQHLPPKLIQQQILITGGAFRMRYSFAGEKDKKRFFFVLNLKPDGDAELVIVSATTKIKERRAVRPPEVLVEFTRAEYAEMDQETLVDCSAAQLWQKKEFIKKIAAKEVQPLERLPDAILTKLRKAVSASKTLDPRTKRLVLGSEQGPGV